MAGVVVGVDGSEGAAEAFRWATGIAADLGEELVALHVFRLEEVDPPVGWVEQRRQEVLALMHQEYGATEVGGRPVQCVAAWGDPRSRLVQVARRQEASLLVAGRVGRSAGPGWLRLGSAAAYLVHHVDRPLALVTAPRPAVQKLLVGDDGSSESDAAMAWAEAVALAGRASIVAVGVDQPFIEWTPATSPHNWRRGVERDIDERRAGLAGELGDRFRSRAVRGGDVAAALLETAADEDADTVVVGMRGLGGFSGLRIGGAAVKLVHQADRTIVLVPPS